ncbi:MAG: (d)CMP kinase [Oscillospiraceae bacterium]
MPINVAIDGPAGAGKSTLARAAAEGLGYIYVDTGALYRSVAYYVLKNGKDPKNSGEVIALLPEIRPELKYIDGVQHVFINGEDVSDHIRTPEISMNASAVSAIPEVRQFLFDIQKNIAANNNIIMDGRDIGTVVLPDAQVKIYLTASDKVRAERRCAELIAKGENADFDTVLDDIRRRDYNDMHRETAPLKQAEDAVLLDTSELDPEQSLSRLVEIIRSRI